MIVIDSSIWIDHLRSTVPHLAELLIEQRAVQHSGVIAELALGSIAERERFLGMLVALPQIHTVSDDQLLDVISEHALYGTGIGYVDAHLLASTLATADARLWTSDKRLAAQAERLGCSYQPPH